MAQLFKIISFMELHLQRIVKSSLFLPFTDATGPLTNAGLNYLIYNLANTTLAADISNGQYTQEIAHTFSPFTPSSPSFLLIF